MNISSIVNRTLPPKDWDTWTKIPWNDPEFSARMLESHLSQDHDWASRTAAIIAEQTAFINRHLPERASVLDLGCGPGLYLERLHVFGHTCTGVDFSPASIDHAKSRPGAGQIRYVLDDIRSFQTPEKFDAVLILFGEINVFSPDEALSILQNARLCLKKGGKAFVEVHTEEAIRDIGNLPPTWTTIKSGLFSPAPHISLEEHFWNEERAAAMTRYYIVDAATAQCAEYGALMQAYTQEAYSRLFAEAGFTAVRQAGDGEWPTGAVFAGKLQCFVCE